MDITSSKYKYLKYKEKYLKQKELCGGKLYFKPCNNVPLCGNINCNTGEYALLRMKDNKLIEMCSRSTVFSKSQLAAINMWGTNVLPFVKINGIKLGNVYEQLETMYAGTFGVTVYFKKLLVKIIKIENPQQDSLEVLTMQNIISSPDFKQNGLNISEYYGYMTTNDIFIKNVKVSQSGIDYKTDLPKNGKVLTMDLSEIKKVSFIDNTLLFLFQDKATENATDFFAKSAKDIIIDFIVDVTRGLIYLHHIGYIHNDIKPDNVVYTNETKYFQLIDFGLSTKYSYNNIKYINYSGGSPAYFLDTIFNSQRSFFYDWHCLYISVLMCLGEIKITNHVEFNSKVDPALNGVNVNKFGMTPNEQSNLRGYFKLLCGHYNIPTESFVNQMIMLSNARSCHSRRRNDIILYDKDMKTHVIALVVNQEMYEAVINMLYTNFKKLKELSGVIILRNQAWEQYKKHINEFCKTHNPNIHKFIHQASADVITHNKNFNEIMRTK